MLLASAMSMNYRILFTLLLLWNCRVCVEQETNFKLCTKKATYQPAPLVLKVTKKGCQGCEELKNCSTFEGSIQIQKVKKHLSEEIMSEFHFPKLTEITGHLLVSLVYGKSSLKDVFPNLAVIRGREVFLDYSLVIYWNDGLKELNLPSLTKILDGGVRVEKNLDMCYVKTVRWKSIMKTSTDDNQALVLNSNNNECYDACFENSGAETRKMCVPPAGHGSLVQRHCWAPGNGEDHECQWLCDAKCGDSGCLNTTNNQCCHKQCLGGCSSVDSPKHCFACQHFRIPESGECVERCPDNLWEVDGFKCLKKCPDNFMQHYFKLDGKCVKACPAGYKADGDSCKKCAKEKCPRKCDFLSPIDSMESLLKYKGCTEIDGNLVINIRGSGGSGIGKRLEENLGKIEKVKGYIVVRESAYLVSLNFLKNLEEIEPKLKIDINTGKRVPRLYNDRYALAIMDNPKLEAMWPLERNLSISAGGIIVHFNPFLCPSKIKPLKYHIERWGKNDTKKHIDISDSTNGIAAACAVQKINVTVQEVPKAPGRQKCDPICIKVEWEEVSIDSDYRNVLFYTVSYREAPNTNITEYDDTDACNSDGQIWTRLDTTVKSPPGVNVSLSGTKRRKLLNYVGKLKPFTLYAFQVEAVVLTNEGAKSDLVFIQTQEKVPSQPVGLEANYINSSALHVKWQPPLFPNGIITYYTVKYYLSSYSPWKRDLNWCNRQIFGRRHDEDKGTDKGNTDKAPDGSCSLNVTCNCDKDKEEKILPEKQAALFAIEFQDKFYKTVFTKNEDDDKKDDTRPTTASTTAPTTAPTTASTTGANCSNDAQNSSCTPPTTSSAKTTIASKEPSKSPPTGSTTPRTTPTISSSQVTLNGTDLTVTLGGLKYFSDYTITVCACTKVGCARDKSCAVTKGLTFKNEEADNLGGPLRVRTENETNKFYLFWEHPKEPNGVVLRYEIEIGLEKNSSVPRCTEGKEKTYRGHMPVEGSYSARVRAITPAGNGSWSNTVFFSWQSKDKNTHEKHESWPLGTVVGASLAASVVFVLACGFVLWYIARKRLKEKQIPGVLYASVNPEYTNATDVYIADEWEVLRDKIKLIRELGNGSFGMVYEGEADIVPGQRPRRVAVKTVSENASIRDRVEFLQEASVMKAFDSNHVVRLLGVVSEGQPTLVIMELMENGDLKNFLRSRRPGEGSLPPPTLQELLQMAGEIADGMAYLAARKYVHRDLAARNCMVNHNFTVKIGDFGMTRDIYETDYYRKGGKGLLPVRWMAPESLKDGVFTSYSDVWSFGVVMWEMATLASQPYPGKSNEDVLKFVVNGGLLEKPEECPERLFEIMALCWHFNPKSRPTFVYLISRLEDDLSPSFRELSFYHTLSPDQLEGLLNSHCKHRNRTGTVESSPNIESMA